MRRPAPGGPFRVGILGAGNISDTHARAAREAAGVEVVAHWSRSAERAAERARRHGGAPYHDLAAFLRHRPMEAVLVGTPSGTHAGHAAAAARAGLHVLVEKPLDVTAARADEAIGACDRAGVTLGVCFQDRAAPALQWLRRTIAAGALGEIVLVSARVRWYRPPEYYQGSAWRGTWALDGGGALMNQGIHTVDLLLWLLGDVERVQAIARTIVHDVEVEDTVVASFALAGGGIGTLEAATSAYPGQPRRLEITGTMGTVAVEGDRIAEVALRRDPPERPPADAGSASAGASASATSPVVGDTAGHRRLIEDFARAVRTDTAPLCDGREGRRSVALAEAIYRAARGAD